MKKPSKKELKDKAGRVNPALYAAAAGAGAEVGRRKKGCFIATACCGINSQEVAKLQNWRDTKLEKTPIGKNFVKAYCRISPKIADFIKNKETCKKAVRFFIRPLSNFV